MVSNPRYGKTIDEVSYNNSNVVTVKRSIEESIAVDGMMQVLEVVGAACKDLATTDNHSVVIEIYADHATLKPVRVVKRWRVEREKT